MWIGLEVDIFVNGPAIAFAAATRSLRADLVPIILRAIGMHLDDAIKAGSTGNDDGFDDIMLALDHHQVTLSNGR